MFVESTTSPYDPAIDLENKIAELRAKIDDFQRQKSEILADRQKWPKLIYLNVGQGRWNRDVMDVFARRCGWLPSDNSDTGLGPVGGGKYIASAVTLIYEAHEDGTLRLVGARDADFGEIGVGHTSEEREQEGL